MKIKLILFMFFGMLLSFSMTDLYAQGTFNEYTWQKKQPSPNNAIGLRSYGVFDIYPNPANSKITVVLSGNIKTANFDILNLYGQKQRSGLLTKAKSTINVSDIPAGVYFIKFNAKNKVYVSKVVLQ